MPALGMFNLLTLSTPITPQAAAKWTTFRSLLSATVTSAPLLMSA